MPGMRQSLAYIRKDRIHTRRAPVHPGELLGETLSDLGISRNRLALDLHVPANRISAIVAGKRSVTGETALRLARYFGTTPEYWMNLQARFDLETAIDEYEGLIASEIKPREESACA